MMRASKSMVKLIIASVAVVLPVLAVGSGTPEEPKGLGQNALDLMIEQVCSAYSGSGYSCLWGSADCESVIGKAYSECWVKHSQGIREKGFEVNQKDIQACLEEKLKSHVTSIGISLDKECE